MVLCGATTHMLVSTPVLLVSITGHSPSVHFLPSDGGEYPPLGDHEGDWGGMYGGMMGSPRGRMMMDDNDEGYPRWMMGRRRPPASGGESESTRYFGGSTLDGDQDDEDMMENMREWAQKHGMRPEMMADFGIEALSDELYFPRVSCKSDLSLHSVEAFLMDRSNMASPIKLMEDRPKLYRYSEYRALRGQHP